jgi:hypothetical protein
LATLCSNASPGLVAERVVDVSEMIDVEFDHGDALAVCLRRVDIAVERVDERCAIRQAGERITRGEFLDAHFVELAPGDVLRGAEDTRDFAVDDLRIG